MQAGLDAVYDECCAAADYRMVSHVWRTSSKCEPQEGHAGCTAFLKSRPAPFWIPVPLEIVPSAALLHDAAALVLCATLFCSVAAAEQLHGHWLKSLRVSHIGKCWPKSFTTLGHTSHHTTLCHCRP